MFTLPDLPYGYEALQPMMSSETLHLHHDKHHARYFAVMNDILKDRGDVETYSEGTEPDRHLVVAPLD